MPNKIQIRRGLKASLPTLSVGEPAFTTDSKELYIGSSTGNVKITGTASSTTTTNPVDYRLFVNTTSGEPAATVAAGGAYSFDTSASGFGIGSDIQLPQNPGSSFTKAVFVLGNTTGVTKMFIFDFTSFCLVSSSTAWKTSGVVTRVKVTQGTTTVYEKTTKIPIPGTSGDYYYNNHICDIFVGTANQAGEPCILEIFNDGPSSMKYSNTSLACAEIIRNV